MRAPLAGSRVRAPSPCARDVPARRLPPPRRRSARPQGHSVDGWLTRLVPKPAVEGDDRAGQVRHEDARRPRGFAVVPRPEIRHGFTLIVLMALSVGCTPTAECRIERGFRPRPRLAGTQPSGSRYPGRAGPESSRCIISCGISPITTCDLRRMNSTSSLSGSLLARSRGRTGRLARSGPRRRQSDQRHEPHRDVS